MDLGHADIAQYFRNESSDGPSLPMGSWGNIRVFLAQVKQSFLFVAMRNISELSCLILLYSLHKNCHMVTSVDEKFNASLDSEAAEPGSLSNGD